VRRKLRAARRNESSLERQIPHSRRIAHPAAFRRGYRREGTWCE
jgi:hypothetical protein